MTYEVNEGGLCHSKPQTELTFLKSRCLMLRRILSSHDVVVGLVICNTQKQNLLLMHF